MGLDPAIRASGVSALATLATFDASHGFDATLRLVETLLPVHLATLVVRTSEGPAIFAARPVDVAQADLLNLVTRAANDAPLTVPCLDADARFAAAAAAAGQRFAAVQPLTDRHGAPAGVLAIFDPAPRDALPSTFPSLHAAVEEQVGYHVALSEADLLLAEIDHRTKNALATVSGFLRLHAKALQGDARDALSVAETRVTAAALLHEQLYRGGDPSGVELDSFLTSILDHIGALAGDRISLSGALQPQRVAPGIASSVGLWVNEIVTNAAKHAFAPNDDGRIEVSLRMTDDAATVEVRDDGRGIPADFSLKGHTGLGLRVSSGLAARLRGQMEVARVDPGSRFSLTFPLA